MVANQPKRRPRKGTLFPQVKAAAAALGVHRVTLYRVLKGHYPDRQNLARQYRAWLRNHSIT